MKSLPLVLVLFASSNAFACLGGKAEFANGNVVLTADRARADAGMSDFDATTEEMLEDELSFGFTDSSDDYRLKTVSVAHVKRDHGGIIFTVYAIQADDEKEPTYIKVESNYKGGGVTARGLFREPEFKIAETYGC